MSERKAINKYYPPDYDPSKVAKRRKIAPRDIKVRLMAPFSMRCSRCNEFIAERRKFNARKEITSETYMDIKIIRFHITCPRCNNAITFKTSPQTAGYVPETGAFRNYQLLKPTNAIERDNPGAKEPETTAQILERLEREEQDNQSYQKLQAMRKRNPFWQQEDGHLRGADGGITESLEARMRQQQHENEVQAELELLRNRQEQIAALGGDLVVGKLAIDAVSRALDAEEEKKQLEETERLEEARYRDAKRDKKTYDKGETEENKVKEDVSLGLKLLNVIRRKGKGNWKKEKEERRVEDEVEKKVDAETTSDEGKHAETKPRIEDKTIASGGLLSGYGSSSDEE